MAVGSHWHKAKVVIIAIAINESEYLNGRLFRIRIMIGMASNTKYNTTLRALSEVLMAPISIGKKDGIELDCTS